MVQLYTNQMVRESSNINLKFLIFYSMALFSFFAIIYVLLGIGFSSSLYSWLWIWPLTFLMFILIVYFPSSIQKKEHSFVIHAITVAALFPRYIVYPILVASLPTAYIGVQHFSIAPKFINEVIIHGSIELIFLGILISFIEHKKSVKRIIHSRSIRLEGNKIIYASYLLISFLLYITIGRNLNIIQFLNIDSDFSYSKISSNVYYILVKYILSVALSIIALVVIDYASRKYKRARKKKYVYIGLIAGVTYTLFIFGESRGTQIAIGILMCVILIDCFNKDRIGIILIMGFSLFLVVFSISYFRKDSLFQDPLSIELLANKIQVYFGGPASLAQPIIVLEDNGLSINQFVFDFIRSIFPLNLLFKNFGYTTSQLYNIYLYDGLFSHGHIVFGSSFGYLYFGIFGVPVNICINIFLGMKVNEFYYSSNSFEGKYISGYCMIRLIQATFSNTPTILGSITQMIGTFGILYFFSKRIK